MSAKRICTLLLSLGWLAANAATSPDQPQGKLIELHSCEVYAGGCMVSSQSTLGGRTKLQVWDIAGGSWQGVHLQGLQVAVLESSSENLAVPTAHADQAVVYVPENATVRQRNALLAWIRSRDAKLKAVNIQTRVVPISLTSSAETIVFRAGPFVAMRVAALGECHNRICGESLWYEPTTPTSQFTVALNEDSRINEPMLKLTWNDFGKRSVFVGRFGDTSKPQTQYVQSSHCGPSGLMF